MRKINSLIGKEFDSEHDGSDKYIKKKIKTYGDKVNTNVQGKKVPKEDASYKFLLLIMLDSVMRLNKGYYSQTFLERCSYETKKRIKWGILFVAILNQVHQMSLIMNLKVILTTNLIMLNLIMMNLIINLLINLKIKTVF